MNIKHIAAAIFGLACVSAAEAPQNYRVYGGPDVTSDPIILEVYDRALTYCTYEASMPQYGAMEATPYIYNAALRACLSRHGFSDRGSNAYPTNSLF